MSHTQRLALAMLLADDDDEEIQFNQYDVDADAEALDCLAPDIMNPSNLELNVVW